MTHGTEAVRELTARRPLALGVLYELGLDASCARCTLEVACRQYGLDPARVLESVTAAERSIGERWSARSVNELVEHVLVDYHRTFARDFDAAERAVLAARPLCDRAAWTDLQHLLGELRADMEQHMAKEEHVLFPWLRSRAPTAAAPIRAMQLEHADTIMLLHAVHDAMTRCLASSTDPAAREAIDRIVHVERTLCEHMHLENNELFPRALEAGPSR